MKLYKNVCIRNDLGNSERTDGLEDDIKTQKKGGC